MAAGGLSMSVQVLVLVLVLVLVVLAALPQLVVGAVGVLVGLLW